MSKSFSGVAVLVLASLVVAACGGGGDDDGGGSGGGGISSKPMTKEEYAAAFAKAFCTGSEQCCEKYGAASDVPNDCEASLTASVLKRISEHDAVAGVEFDQVRAGECIAWIEKLLKQCTQTTSEKAAYAQACEGVFAGGLEENEVCTDSLQCSGHESDALECQVFAPPEGAVSWRCQKPAAPVGRGTRGEGCVGTCWTTFDGIYCFGGVATAGSKQCWVDDGLFCDASSKCVDAVSVGGACDSSKFCVSAAWCQSGKCVEKGRVGDPCDPTVSAWTCGQGAYCEAATTMCAAQGDAGASCKDPESCKSGLCLYGRCMPEDAFIQDVMCAEK